MALKGIPNYLRNVTKSVAYAAADIAKDDLTPNVAEFVDSNKSFGVSTFAAIKNPKATAKRQINAFQHSKVFEAISYGTRNTFEDLRTGNFYNKAREDRDLAKLAGFDTDDWNDFSEWDDQDDSSSSSSSSSMEITAGDKKVVQAIEGSNAAAASATVNAVIQASEYQAKISKANVGILYQQNEVLFGGLHRDMSILNATMDSMFKLQSSSLQNMDKNMSGYFTESIKLDTERNAILRELLEMQRNQYKSALEKEKESAGKRSKGKARWSDIQIGGVADFDRYFENVKKNISEELSGFGMSGFGEDSNMLATFMVSPLKGVTKAVINGIIPATVKMATKELDSTINGVFGNLIGILGNANGKDGILGMLSKFLGVNTGVNRSIDTSRYEKGPVPFDGITRKAIIDVIPTHLRRIEAAITGKPEQIFDYNAGRWVKMSSVKEQYANIKKGAINNATQDLRYAMNPSLRTTMNGMQMDERDEFEKAQQEFYEFLYENNGRFNPKKSYSSNGISRSKYPNLCKHYSKIVKAYTDFDTDSNNPNVHRKNSIRMNLPGNVLNAKDYENSQYRNIESSVSNVFHQYFGAPEADTHGSYGKNGSFTAYNALNKTKDEYGNTIFNYLYNINKELTYQRLNGLSSGAGRRSRKSGKGTSFENINLMNAKLVEQNDADTRKKVEKSNKIREQVLSSIQSGKAVDLRSFNGDEQEYLLHLGELFKNNATGEYYDELGTYTDSNIIADFLDKNIFKSNIRSMQDVQSAIDEANRRGVNTGDVKLDEKEKNFLQKLFGKITSFSGNFAGASAQAFTNVLYAADRAIYEMMYKTELDGENGSYNGFMEMMAGKMNKTFEDVSKKFQENIIEPFKKRFGLGDDTKDRFKNELGRIGRGAWGKFKQANAEVYGPMVSGAKNIVTGGVINRYAEENGFTGTVEQKLQVLMSMGVSESELKNLTDHDKLNKKFHDIHRKNNARGTMKAPFMGRTMLSKGEMLFNSKGASVVKSTGAYDINEPTHILNSPDSHDLLSSLGYKNLGPKSTIQQDIGRENLAKKRIFENASGTINAADIEVAANEAKKLIPEAAAGGLVGGTISLLFGLVGGPLLGAAVGAGGSIISSSETIKSKLFGEIGEDGKRDGSGFISKKVMDAVNKYVPNMTKYGMAGIIPGLITPLGPIGGLLIGSAVGYLKSNEEVKEKFFGPNGKFAIGDKEKKIIEDMLPGALKGAGIGAVATLFGGPFGLLGNAAVGSAIGIVASTEEFKSGILGETINGVRVGGLAEAIGDAFKPLTDGMGSFKDKLLDTLDKNIIKPINDFITPTIHAVPQVAGWIARKISDKVDKFGNTLSGFLKDKLTTPLGKALDKVIAPAANTVTKVITSPVRLLGTAGNAIRKRQINTMNADYMTADERMTWRAEHGMGTDALDTLLSDIGKDGGMSVIEARQLRDSLYTMNDTVKNTNRAKKDQEKKINNIINSYKTEDGKQLSAKAKKKIREYLYKGDTESAMKVLQTYRLEGSDRGLTREQADSLLNGDLGLKNEMNSYIDLANREKRAANITKEERDAQTAQVKEAMAKLGLGDINLDDEHTRNKLAKYFNTEILRNEANPDEMFSEEALNKDNNELFKQMVSLLTDIANIQKGILTGDVSYIKKANVKQARATDKAMQKVFNQYDENDERAKDMLGENYEDLSNETKDQFSAQSTYGPIRVSRANKDLRRAAKFRMSADEINAAGGKALYRVDEFKKLGYELDQTAVDKLNSINNAKWKIAKKFLSSKTAKDIIKGRNLTGEDIDFAIAHSSTSKEFFRRCRIVLKAGKTSADYPTLNAISMLSGAELNQMQVPNNGLGTMILGGIVNGVKSLFGGKSDGEEAEVKQKKSGGMLSGLSSILGKSDDKAQATSGDFDEVDKAGDGKDVAMLDGTPVLVERGSDGSVQYDTSDNQTKAAINKATLKEKALQKLQEAQAKACETIQNTFDTSGVKESKKGKIGWFQLLLLGGLIAKSGIVGKLFNGLIKPIWTDHIKPWITDTAIPWVKSMWSDKIKPFFTDTVAPWITDTAIPAVTDGIARVLGYALSNLPAILKGTFKFAGTVLDYATGNKYNAGATTTVDGNELSDKYGSDTETEMYDENGNKLTAGDIASGNYTKIYNNQGVEGTVGEDGKVSFKDQSMVGASYLTTVGDAALHAGARTLGGGKGSLLNKGLKTVGNFLSKSINPIKKIVGKGTKAFTSPIEAAENLGTKLSGKWTSFTDGLVDSAVDRIIKNEGLEPVETLAREALNQGDGSMLSKVVNNLFGSSDSLVGKAKAGIESIKSKVVGKAKSATAGLKGLFSKGAKEATEEAGENIVEETVQAAANEAIEKAVEGGASKAAKEVAEEVGETAVETAVTGAAKNSSFLSKLLTKAKDAVTGLLSDSTVVKKLTSVAESLGEKSIGKWIKKFTDFVSDLFKEAMEKGVEKVGADTCKKVLSKALAIVFLVKDFVTGCDQAESILGVSETSLVEELVAGLLNALCEFLIIPSIFPGTNWIARQIYGFFDSDLETRQSEAEAEYNEYVETTGSTWTQEEYLKRKKSVTGAIGGWAGDRVDDVVGGVKAVGKGAVDAANWVGDKASSAASWIGDKASSFASFLGFAEGTTTIDEVKNWIGKAVGGLLGTSNVPNYQIDQSTSDNPILAAFSKIGTYVTSPIRMMNTMFSNISDLIGNAADELMDETGIEDVLDKARKGKISIFSKDYWDDDQKANTLGSGLAYSFGKLAKLMNFPMLMVKATLENLSSDITTVGKTVVGGSAGSNQINSITSSNGTVDTTNSSTAKSTSAAATFVGNVKSLFSNAVNKVKTFFGFGSGPAGYQYGTGYSKQIDPSISNVQFNSSQDSTYQTIGDSGCGPAAAVNALESIYGRGNGNAVLEAANYAISRGYKEQDGGTKPGFFTDYFNRAGYGSTTSYNTNQIAKNINSGMPTVLMGRDARGTSNSTPFGKTPHYVTVTGTDGNGHAIVQDPESRYENQLYSVNDLMRKTTLGVSAYGKNYNKQRAGRPKFGKGLIQRFGRGLARFGRGLSNLGTYRGIIGHMGYSAKYPENSEQAFINGAKEGMSGLECDLQYKNGSYLVYHDKNNGCTFERYLEICKTYNCLGIVDSKCSTSALKGAYDVVYSKGMTGTIIFQSDVIDQLSSLNKYANSKGGSVRTWYLVSGKWSSSAISSAVSAKCEGINVNWHKKDGGSYCNRSSDLITAAHSSGLCVCEYSIDNAEQRKTAISNGIDFIMSNKPPYSTDGSSASALEGSTSGTTQNTNTLTDISSTATTSLNGSTDSEETIGSMFNNILINSRMGKVLNSFLGTTSQNTTATQPAVSTTTTGTTSSNAVTGSGEFPKYALNDQQIKGVANIIEHEQPGLSGMMAEASLMANLIDKTGDEKATVENLVEYLQRPPGKNWFANGRDRFQNPGNPSSEAIQAAKEVLVNGKRTLPRYVDEHDCFSDIKSASNNGQPFTPSDRSKYQKNVTKLSNVYGSSGTFYCFPNDKADPFYYTSEELRQKWGDNCYSSGTGKGSSPISKLGTLFGRGIKYGRSKLASIRNSKWGRGTDEQIWWYLKKLGMTDEGAAGMMGNMWAESGLRSNNVEDLLTQRIGLGDEEYTKAVDNGTIDKATFLAPRGAGTQYGYGLCQWTSAGRKSGLYDLVKSKNVSIADLGTQLEWLGTELQNSYSSVFNTLKTTNSLQTASDTVLGKFEIPADWGSQSGTRASYGQKYLDKLKGTQGEAITGATVADGSSTVSSSGESQTQEAQNTIFSVLQNVLANSPVGKVLNSFLGSTSSGTTSTDGLTADSSSSGGTVLSGSDAANIAQIAKNEVGTKEGSVNVCKYNDWYYGRSVNGSAYPWCAAFVSWCANQANIPTSVVPKDAYTVTAYQNITTSLGGKKVPNSDAQTGDIIYFTKTGSPSDIYHTGIVTGNSNGTISTVEGNSSDMVAERTYSTSSGKVLVARPAYKNQGSGNTINLGTTTTGSASDAPDQANTLGSNGIKPLSKFGTFKQSLYGRGSSDPRSFGSPVAKRLMSKDGTYAKVEYSPIDAQVGRAVKNASRKVTYTGQNTKYGKGAADYSKLIEAIINILMTIAENTDKLNTIVTILNDKLGTNISAQDVSNATGNKQTLKSKISGALGGANIASQTSKLANYSDSVGDSSFNAIISAMNVIAAE